MNQEKVVGELTQTIIDRRVTLKKLVKVDNKIRKLHTKLIKMYSGKNNIYSFFL